MTKIRSKKFISLLLAVIMLIGMLPMNMLTAVAADTTPTEATDLVRLNYIDYSDGLIQYLKYNNYLYQVKYTNIKDTSQVCLTYYSTTSVLQLGVDGNVPLYLSKSSPATAQGDAYVSDLPTTHGKSLDLYGWTGSSYITDTTKPVVTVTCLAVNEPTWDWADDYSSATAKFVSTDGKAYIGVTATIASETTYTAANCLEKDQITYTATVTRLGQQYQGTKTVDGAAGPHTGYTYTASGSTITESCANNCGTHSGTATISADNRAYDSTAYNGAKVEKNNFVGELPAITYEGTGSTTYGNSTTPPTAVGTYKAIVTAPDGSTSAFAEFSISETIDISTGSVVISKKDDQTVTVQYGSSGSKDYAIGESIYISGTTTANSITVQSGNPTVVLSNVSITGVQNAFSINSGASVNLVLNGTNTLTSTIYAGISVASSASITISGEGSLTATGGQTQATSTYKIGSAGIGGWAYRNSSKNYCYDGGSITINSGTIYAYGNGGGAGIGGGSLKSFDGITINGGTVVATGGVRSSGKGGDGIGAGYSGSNKEVVIAGGSVKASHGGNADVIGGPATNGSTTLSLITITLSGAGDGISVTDVDFPEYFNTNGVKTMDGSKLYFYLPSGVMPTSITAGGTTYVCNRSNTYYTSHKMTDATCTTAKTCAECGYTEGEALGHDWSGNDGICKNDTSHIR